MTKKKRKEERHDAGLSPGCLGRGLKEEKKELAGRRRRRTRRKPLEAYELHCPPPKKGGDYEPYVDILVVDAGKDSRHG